MRISEGFVRRVGRVAVICALGWSCGPPGGPGGAARRARPVPRPRRATVAPLEQMRVAMRGWVKQLRAAEAPVDLARVFQQTAGRTVSFAHEVRCSGRSEAFEVVVGPGLAPPTSGAGHAPRATGASSASALPAFFVHVFPAPASESPARRALAPTPPRNCLVWVTRRAGGLTLVAAPVALDSEDQEVDKARFLRWGTCQLLQLDTSHSEEASDDNGQHSERGTRRRLIHPGHKAADVVGRYLMSFEEQSPPGGSTNTSGTVTWLRVGGAHLLYYQADRATVVSSPAYGHKVEQTRTVEKLSAACTLEEVDPGELHRLRSLPGGSKLPDHQTEPGEDD